MPITRSASRQRSSTGSGSTDADSDTPLEQVLLVDEVTVGDENDVFADAASGSAGSENGASLEEEEEEEEEEDEEEEVAEDSDMESTADADSGDLDYAEVEAGTSPRVCPPQECLKGELAYRTNLATSAVGLRRKCHLPCVSLDPADQATTASWQKASTSAPDTAGTSSVSHLVLGHTVSMVHRREVGLGPAGGTGFSPPERRHLQCRALPVYATSVVDRMSSRCYIGQFSQDGSLFVAAYQDQRVRLYDVEREWKLRKDITTKMIRWTITDTCISPDQRFIIYASITPTVHAVRIGSYWDGVVDSRANVTEVHEAMHFDQATTPGAPPGDRSFGIWSVRWSGDGREIIAGTNDHSIYVFDVETQRVLARVEGHRDDVNAVAFADPTSNTILSGSDDNLIKVWDRRTLGQAGSAPRASGMLVGHTEGITHIDPRGDGIHFISNGKDQAIKLWDMRKMQSEANYGRGPRAKLHNFHWDYRWQEWPGSHPGVDMNKLKHPHDMSLMTYRGHAVLQTLIRAYFSPAHSTGQRFIYTGSQDNAVHIYDIVTGRRVERLRHHRSLVRDCSWHPYRPQIVSVSWDGNIVSCEEIPSAATMALKSSDQRPLFF